MPHDVALPELSPTDIDPADLNPELPEASELQDQGEHRQNPSILAQMKKAGRKLVRAARRIGPKALLSGALAAGAAFGAIKPAEAATVTATLTGTVSSGTDTSGVFGFAPGTSLAGQNFTLTFTFNDTQGQQYYSATETYITSTSNSGFYSNPGTATLQIGGGAFTFGVLHQNAGSMAERVIASNSSELYFSAGDGAYEAGSGIGITIYPSNPAVVTNVNWYAPISLSGLAAGNNGFEITESAANERAAGYLTVSTVTVNGPVGMPSYAKSLGDTGGKSACGCDAANSAPQLTSSDPAMQNTGMATVGDPINVATGNVFYQATDYKTAGPNPLEFTRYYNSMGNATGINTLALDLGTNWRSNYDRYLTIGASTVTAERPDGQVLTFYKAGSAWTSDSDVDATLTQSGSTWTLKDRNDAVETYTQATGTFYNLAITYGQLQSITARNGYEQTLTRSGNDLTVTDSYGRSLQLAYGSNGLLQTLTTPDALAVNYGYQAASGGGNQLTTVSYNTSPATSQTYLYGNASFPFALTGIKDENGQNYENWTYDSSGRATSNQQGSGANLTTMTYNSYNATTVTNALGVKDTYTFLILQGVAKTAKISRASTSTTAAATEAFSYDGSGYLSSKTDWDTNLTNYTNNAQGNPTQIVEWTGSANFLRTTTIAYDPTWTHLPATITTTGLTTGFTYDGNGNPLTRTDTDTTTNTVPYSTKGQTRTTAWTWNGTGEETSVQLPRTDATVKTSFGYDGTGAMTSVTDPLGHTTNITSHTGGGYPTTIVDPNGVTTTLGWDTRLNLNTATLATTAGNLTTTYTHDAANNLTAVQQPDGSKLTYSYDAAHRRTGVADLLGNSIAYTLDALGDATQTTIKNAAGTVTWQNTGTFDALGRALKSTDGAGQTTVFTHDPNGNVLTAQPPSPSGTTTYTYDGINRMLTRADPSPGGTTTFAYDVRDKLTNVKDANGNSTAYTRDGFGDATQIASPDSGKSVYYYDKDSNMTQKVFAGGQIANLTYDANDRNLTVSYPADGTLNIAKTYDQTTGHGFGVGRLTSVTDQAGSAAFAYDERANVTNESRVVTGAGTLNTATGYDAASRVASIAYPSGTVVDYTRDGMGNVTAIAAKPPGASSFSNVASAITHAPFGPETALTFGNGITGTDAVDLAYRPTSRVDASGSTNYQNLAYGYYGNGSVNTVTDGVNATNSQTLGYDTLDRLTSAKSGAGGYGSYAWTWDKVGNVATQTINSVATTFALVSGGNRLASTVTGGVTTTVDTTANGNILDTKIGSTAVETYTYNAANQMASGLGGTYAGYQYGFDGQRIEKAPAGSYPILYQFNRAGNELLSENDLHGGTTADYIYLDPGRNSRPIGEINPTTGAIYAVHTDRLGTPQRVTDANKNVVWSATYNPFGDTNPGAVSGTLTIQSLRLPGQQMDAETGNNHNGFRDYAGSLTRYVQSDPIGLAGGMNTYQYVQGNPFRWTDTWGLDLTTEQKTRVISTARDWTNSHVPYVYGGSTKQGADCSGSISGIYKQSGIDIGRRSSQEFRDDPFTPATVPLQTGDIGVYQGHVVVFGGGDTGTSGTDVWSASHTGGPDFGPSKSTWYGTPTWYRYNPPK